MRSCIPGTVRCSECGASTIVNNWNNRAAPELPEGYREDEDGDLWTDEEVMPTALAYMEEDGSLSFNFTHYGQSESAALFVWLQRRAR
jgi:hypothetical protein